MKKRILSFFLAVVTVLTVIPANLLPVFAVDSDDTEYIDVKDMEVGKVYKAIWDTEYPDFKPAKNVFEVYPSYILKSTVPQELYVKLMPEGEMQEGDAYLYVTNDDWSSTDDAVILYGNIENYRYVEKYELKVIAPIEDDPKPTITQNGKEVDSITILEDGKSPITAKKPDELKGKVDWQWEIYVEGLSNPWVKIEDKTSATCNVTYALVVNLLDDKNQVKLRATASNDDGTYVSDPVTVQVKTSPKQTAPTYDFPAPDNASSTEGISSYGSRSTSNLLSTSNSKTMLLADSVTKFTITVKYIKVSKNGTVKTQHLNVDYDLTSTEPAFTVDVPAILGYYAYAPQQGDDPATVTNPNLSNAITQFTIDPSTYTADTTLTVYYYPKETQYKVIHYVQNVSDDGYSEKLVETKTGTIDSAVPDCHRIGSADDTAFVGLRYQHYDHADVAADGSTVIEIYYDREYYSALFILDTDQVKGAYGQEGLYVKYETTIGVNIPKAPGYLFSNWTEVEYVEENGVKVLKEVTNPKYSGFTSNHQSVQPVIVSNVIFQANWEGVETTYSVVYWKENANDGNYTIWHTETIDPETGKNYKATSGSKVKWSGKIPSYISGDKEYQYFTLNSAKTNAQYPVDAGVVVEGDGSTVINVYFNRRVYDIDFLTTPKNNLTHSHDDSTDPCLFNTMYCTDPKHTTHEHTSACGAVTCKATKEHKHNENCCDTHVHQLACFAGKAEEFSTDGEFANGLVSAVQSAAWQQGNIGATIASSVTARNAAKNKAASMGSYMSKKEPPKNLQNGYVQILSQEEITVTWDGWLNTYSVTVKYDVPAIYIDGNWYYYTGSLSNGSVETVATSACKLSDHDHTSGCTYGTKCTKSEHVHINTCYATCSDKAAQHTAECYGSVCTKPTTQTYTGKTGVTNGTYTVISIQAKYGQDITEMLPYYLELYGYGLHQNASGHNFTGWKYAGTGWAQTDAVTRYVKHVTMVDELCYSEGVTATAQYDANATNAYLLYYLFESLDQSDTNGTKDYKLDGTARQKFNEKWYDSESAHLQLIMWPSANDVIDGGKKDIEGVTFVNATENPATGTLNHAIGTTITSETLNAYFYDRNTITDVKIFNQSHEVENVTVSGTIKYGMSFADVIAALTIPNFGFTTETIPYPDFLESGAYTFDHTNQWYTVPYEDEYNRIDWSAYTVPAVDELNYHAIWRPQTHNIYVYEDYSSMMADKPFSTDNNGTQVIDHRNYAYAPDYELSPTYGGKDGYTFSDWFYIDPQTQTETGFDFAIPITQDMKIYAKWTSRVEIPYKVHYVTPMLDVNNNVVKDDLGNPIYVNIADSLNRTAYAGQSRTFYAASGNTLYGDYQQYYFPTVGSHTIQMEEIRDENDELTTLEYTFYYERWLTLDYTVQYLEAQTNKVLAAPKTASSDKASVVETFLPITDYTADSYYKSIVLAVPEEGETSAEKNVITFYYTKNEDEVVNAKYRINHYVANLDGTYRKHSDTELIGVVDNGKTYYYATVLENKTKIDGYSYSRYEVLTRTPVLDENGNTQYDEYGNIIYSEIQAVTEGVKTRTHTNDTDPSDPQIGNLEIGYYLNISGFEINLYYERDTVGYYVEYRDDSNNVLKIDGQEARKAVSKDASGLLHGEIAEEQINEIWNVKLITQGYQLADPTATTVSMTLGITEAENVMVFYYVKTKSEFFYQIVCDDEDSGVNLSNKAEPKIDANSDGSELSGSTPIESQTYYFAGWFKDEACTIPVDPSTDPVTLDTTNTLMPTKTDFSFEDENGNDYSGELYYSATYYALFLPRSANLEITVTTGQSDSFILTFTGQEGTFAEGKTFTVAVIDGVKLTVTDVAIGTYTVTSNAAWSWRYAQINTTVNVEVSVGGSLTLTATASNTQWLTAEAYGVYASQGN